MYTSKFTRSSDIISLYIVTITDGIPVLVLYESFVNIQTLSLVVVTAGATISLLLLNSILVAEFLGGFSLLGCRIGRVIARAVLAKNIGDDRLEQE